MHAADLRLHQDVSEEFTRRELVFVDESIQDYEQLIDDLLTSRQDGRRIEVVVLDSNGDGIDQISGVLSNYQSLDAVHFVSHGTNGAVKLGSTWLQPHSLNAFAGQIESWGNTLTDDGDLLFYGCDVAADAEGQAFVSRLAQLTRADVAASEDATGNAAFGADWDLEYTTGSIETLVAVNAQTQQDWVHVMAITTGNSTSAGTGASTTGSSLTWSHTVDNGSNGILIVSISIRDASGGTVSSVTYGGTALTQIGYDASDKDRAEMWYLKAPATGTADIVVNLTTAENFVAGATNFFGVDQTTPYGSLTTGNGSSGDPSLTVASATGELVVDFVSDRDVDSETIGADQSALWILKNGNGSNDAWGGSSIEAGAESVTMSWTTTGAGAGEWAAVAVSIKPSASNDLPILADHAAGQETNKLLNATSVTAAELFAFQIENTSGGQVTVSQVQFPLSLVGGIVQGDFANLAIYVDDDNDGIIDGTDTTGTVGGSGLVDGSVTTITFSTSFNVPAGTTVNYILTGDLNNLVANDTVTIDLEPSNFTLTSGAMGGASATSVTHTADVAPDAGADCASALPVTCNSTTVEMIGSAGDLDFFELTVAGPNPAMVTLYTTGETDTYGYLHDTDCAEITQDDDGGLGNNFRITRQLDPGTYYVEVRHNSASETGAYELHVECYDDDYGNTCEDAAELDCNSTMTGAIDAVGDVDYFKIVFWGSGNLTAETSGSTNTYGKLLDTDCALITVDDNSGPDNNFNITQTLTAGVYYVVVKHAGDTSTGNYSLNVQCEYKPVISATAEYGGSISPSGAVAVDYNTNQAFTITPDAGITIKDVWVDGNWLGPLTTYEFTNVTQDHKIVALFNADLESCVDISDIPLDARSKSAPANIMFVLDDSGSMDWEFMTSEDNGKFQNYEYVFNNPGDNVYTWGSNASILPRGYQRMKWKSQWSGYNKLYYDPGVDYVPWPTLAEADPATPRSHPMSAAHTFDLNGSYNEFSTGAGGALPVIVDNQDSGFTKTPASSSWALVTGQSLAENGDYFWTAYDGDYTATWTPDFPQAGEYQVYARWIAHATNRSEAVPYIINHAGGTDTVTVNQRQNGGTFNLLGTYSFNAGTGGNVTITYTRQGDADIVVADAVKFVPADAVPATIDIKRAHYYAWSAQESKPYLVVLDGKIDYYVVNDDGDDVVEEGELLPSSNPPADVVSGRDYVAERQNFANWYQFYRRRELTATAAVARAIDFMQGVRIGIFSINGNLVRPVVPINVDGVDETSVLLDSLYHLSIRGQGTPLRRGLEEVGKYYHNSSEMLGGSPYAAANNGGDCQQAFAIVMTDGYWNGANPNVTNADGDDNTAFDGSGYGDSYAGTLADVAMYYYETDLRTDLANSVPTNEADSATHQHMVTYGVSFGVTGTLTPEDWDVVNGPYPPWPNPKYVDAHKIDDLYHAAVNGRGEFLSASDPSDLIQSLIAIMRSIQSRVASAAAVSVNGNQMYKIVDANTRVFQSSYHSDGWSGDVNAYGVDPITGEIDVTPLWSAAEQLQDLHWDVDRLIATFDGTQGIAFRYNDNLTDSQKIALGSDLTAGSPADQIAGSILDYLRGDTSNEEKNGGNFRNRSDILGDIVSSSPVYDNGMLYTGANDGMMHAFDAATGNEIFAYVPNLVFANLANLADPNYGHKFFVDLPPVVQAVTLTGVSRLLVGGLGKGGKGYYALNVTDPSGLNDSTLGSLVLWEFTDSADLGYTYSRPVIVQSNNGGQWVVIFGNGYNSVNSHAVLFILDAANGSVIRKIDTGVGLCNGLSSPTPVDNNYDGKVDYVYAGDLKGNLWKFDLQGTAAAWDVAYKDLSNNPAPLFQAKDFSGNPQPITTRPDVMFHCGQSGYLVIFGTGRYLGDKDLISSGSHSVYGIWDYGDDDDDSEYLGSFERAAVQKLSNPELRSEVTLLEQTIVSGDWTTSDGRSVRILTGNDPVWATVNDNQDGQEPNPGTATCGDNLDNDADSSTDEADECIAHAGWYFDLPENGEMMVSDVFIKDGKALVTSFTPEQTPCGYGGDSIYHQLKACSGGRTDIETFDVNGDGVIDDQDLINIGTEANPIWVTATGIQFAGRLQVPAVLRLGNGDVEMNYLSSSNGTIETVQTKGPKLGMTYWMQLR